MTKSAKGSSIAHHHQPRFIPSPSVASGPEHKGRGQRAPNMGLGPTSKFKDKFRNEACFCGRKIKHCLREGKHKEK